MLDSAELEPKTKLSIAMELLKDDDSGEIIFTSKSVNPKPSNSDSVIYTYKRQHMTVETAEGMRKLRFHATSKKDGSLITGQISLLDERNNPLKGEQQVQLHKKDEVEPSGILLVTITEEMEPDADTISHSSRRSKMSLKNVPKTNRVQPPSVMEESLEEGQEDEADEQSVISENEEGGEEPFIKFEDTKTEPKQFESGDGIDV